MDGVGAADADTEEQELTGIDGVDPEEEQEHPSAELTGAHDDQGRRPIGEADPEETTTDN